MMGQRAMMAASGLSLIKSIQEIDITISSGNSSNTGTITAVNVNCTALFFAGVRTNVLNASPGGRCDWQNRFELTNSTTITMHVGRATSGDVVGRVTVVEFQPWCIKSIQYGTCIAGSGSTAMNTAVNSADMNHTVCLWLGTTTDNVTQNTTDTLGHVYQVNATQVTTTRSGTTGSITTGFCLLEFQPGILKSNQQTFVSIGSGVATGTTTISSVNLSQAMIMFGGFRSNAFQADLPRLTLTNSTTLTATRNNTPANTCALRFNVVEFNINFIRSIQRGESLKGTSTDPFNVTISSVNRAKAFSNFLAWSTDNGAANVDYTTATQSLTSSTNLQFDCNGTSGSVTTTYSWEVVEFK